VMRRVENRGRNGRSVDGVWAASRPDIEHPLKVISCGNVQPCSPSIEHQTSLAAGPSPSGAGGALIASPTGTESRLRPGPPLHRNRGECATARTV
jgi:hypothetical protein